VIAQARAVGSDDHTVETAVLQTVQELHWSIHRATLDYQEASEDRRHLAAEIGERTERHGARRRRLETRASPVGRRNRARPMIATHAARPSEVLTEREAIALLRACSTRAATGFATAP
jgi:hypothetical protein